MADAAINTYITYLLPGSFYPEHDTRQVPDRNPQRDADTAPDGAFAFTYHDIAVTTVDTPSGQVQAKSAALNKSGWHYIDADEMTSADVEALPGDHAILLANMRGNGWDPIWRCRTGNFQPKEDGDVLVRTRQGVS